MKLIDLIESFKNIEIELVVQDNSDNNDEILAFLKERHLVSTRYYYCTEMLSMSQNADKAVKNSTGSYVCFIGDDDAVCRTIVDCAKWMKNNDIDALRSLYVQYSWNEQYSDSKCGSLLYDKNYGIHYKVLNSLNELRRVLRQGVPDFRLMPKLYHGIVKRDLLDKLYAIGGTCFPGPTPDMSSAVSLCFYIKKYAYIDVPVVLPGMSRMVGGGVMGKVLTLDKVKFISDEDRNNWEKDFPKLWATQLIWPDCALKALRYVGHEDYIKKYFRKNKMLFRLVVINHRFLKEAFLYSNNKVLFPLEFFLYVLKEGLSFFWRKKILVKLTGKEDGKLIRKSGFKGIAHAEDYLNNLIATLDFSQLIKTE